MPDNIYYRSNIFELFVQTEKRLDTFTQMCADHKTTKQKTAQPCIGPRGLNFS